MKTLTKDEFMEAWSIDRAKIVFKDGDSFNGIDEIEIYTEDRKCILEPLSEVKEIDDLDK